LIFENEKEIPTFAVPDFNEQETIDDKDIPMIDESHPSYQSLLSQAVFAEDDFDYLELQRSRVLKATMEKLQKQFQPVNKHYNKSQMAKPNISNNSTNNNTNNSTNNNTNNTINNSNNMNKKNNNNQNEDNETQLYNKEAARPNEAGETSFNNNEVNVPEELRVTYWWHDKYRPRKPRYFNRVKTGYSWNKYNQTHYDPDNPPPKIVQGYKFNIFYPDLIDNTKTPTYKIYERPGDEYAIIVFHSGPPYEDIAFKIVNNEWEPSHTRGFRCRFERGIFSLYFNFKRYRYRR